MKVVERINEILKEKNMSKKELANRLINLGMKANKTGEIPTLSSIYAYLNGNIDIKADMIPFIADALGVFEQELFMDKKEIEEIFKKMGVSKDIFIVEYETLKNETKKIAVKSYTKKMAIEKFEDYCTENKIDDIVDCWIKED